MACNIITTESGTMEELLKPAMGILNKLTESNFDQLHSRFQKLNIATADQLIAVTKLLHRKAIAEPIFSSIYARLCKTQEALEIEGSCFCTMLLASCQIQFDKRGPSLADIENQRKITESSPPSEELMLKLEIMESDRRACLGNIKFIGELFKTGFMPLKMVQEYLLNLTSSAPSGLIGDEERDVECLCRLLAIVGRDLEGYQPIEACYRRLDRVIEEDRASNRIRFMIQDLLEMRQNDWVSRRQLRNPFHFTAPSSVDADIYQSIEADFIGNVYEDRI